MTAFAKTWLGTEDTDYTNAANWQALSICSSAWSWTASGTGTNEYYLRTAASGDPGFGGAPGLVLVNGVAATPGAAGSLAAGEWAYDDNDTLGYSTIYLRLADGADPDSKARDYVQFQQIPLATDHVTISGLATNGIAGSDQSAVAIGNFYIEPGFLNLAIGALGSPLRIDPNSFISEGSGSEAWYLDLHSAAILPEIRNCPTPGSNIKGLYLTGSALTGLIIDRGSLALAALPGDSASATTILVRGSQALVLLSETVTMTTLRQIAGNTTIRCNATTIEALGGALAAELAAAFDAINIEGATVTDRSTGTWAAVVLEAGTLDTMALPAAKTYTAMKHNAGTFREHVDLLTITTRQEPDFAGNVTRQRVA